MPDICAGRAGVWLLAGLMSGVMMACASTAPRMGPDEVSSEAGAIWEGASGESLPTDEVVEALAATEILVVGERHADAHSVAAQLEVLRLVEQSGRSLVVGVEWLPRSSTGAVREYVEGRLTEQQLVEAADWESSWGFPFAVYAPIFRWARAHRVYIHGLNAPKGLARRLGRVGVAGLSEDERSGLTPLDSGDEDHRAYFSKRMSAVASAHGGGHHGGHGGAGGWEVGSALLERYYLSQLLRDETMAEAAADLRGGGVVVVFAGLGHVEHGLGIPMRLGRLVDDVPLIVEPWVESVPHCGGDVPYPERRCDLRVRVPQ